MKINPKISKLKYLYFILIFSILVISGTYAYQQLTASSSNPTGSGGCFNVNYTGQNITTSDLSTTTNYQEGSKTTVTLSKHSSCKMYTEANIYLKTNNTTTAPIETVPALRYKLFKSASQISEGIITNKNDYLLATVPLTDTQTTYTVYLYVDADTSIGKYDNKSYSGYIYAESAQTSTIEGHYQVSFDTNNGETLNLSKTVTNGQPYGWLPTPYKAGYNFTGWKLSNTNITSSTTVTQTQKHTLTAQWEQALYTVRFNPNGGTVSPQTKQVNYGSTYGSLPIPNKAGSTFKGWNGKNLINVSNHNVTFTNTYYVENTPTPKFMLKSDKTYTLSFNHKVNSASRNIFASVGYGVTGFQRDIQSSSNYTGTGTSVITFTTPSTFNYNPPYVSFRLVRMSSTGDANVDISNVQLEEGPSATAYEPYYITSTTTVVQDKSHTLTAIWE